MIIHVESPTEVRLVSVLDADRRRETLFRANAIVSEFRFDRWYDQEGFMLGLQANFQPTTDLNLILKVSGNIEKKNNAAYSDDGVSQVVTMQTGRGHEGGCSGAESGQIKTVPHLPGSSAAGKQFCVPYR